MRLEFYLMLNFSLNYTYVATVTIKLLQLINTAATTKLIKLQQIDDGFDINDKA